MKCIFFDRNVIHRIDHECWRCDDFRPDTFYQRAELEFDANATYALHRRFESAYDRRGRVYTTCNGDELWFVSEHHQYAIFSGRRGQLHDHPVGYAVFKDVSPSSLDVEVVETTRPEWAWWETARDY